MATNEINVFATYDELKNKCSKESHKAISDFNRKHYVVHCVLFQGQKNDRLSWLLSTDSSRPKHHQYSKIVRDDLDEAFGMRNRNFERYIKEYNRRNADKFENLDELRNTSLWRDYNHNGINGYHGVSEHTKYCPLHLKDENPRWYAGIELEITFDRDIVGDAYNGDRFDEDGNFDDEGEYDDEGNYIPDTYEFDLDSIAKRVTEISKGLFTLERDSSLEYGYSFEMVSRPLSKRAWHCDTVVNILHDVLGYIKEQGGMIEQPEENGFHIHISRKFFETNTTRSARAIERDLNWVFQRYQEEIETIGGRMYNDWCASAKMRMKQDLIYRYGNSVLKAQITKDSSRIELPYADHHRAFIGSDSGYTYEARVFHSTLDPERVLACIEFMSDISHGARDNALEGKTFGQITKYKESPYLQKLIHKIKYEKKQKLALNKKNTNRVTVEL